VSHTLLDAVNETLKRANVIVTGALFTSLTDGAQQHNIDIAVQVINEGIDELYSGTKMAPKEQAESTITLVTGQREYALASDLIRLLWPMIDRTNLQYLWEFPGEYDDLLFYDPQQVYTGLPLWAKISPITGSLRIDRACDAQDNGRIYTYEYEKNVTLTNASDVIPFNDETFRAMVPCWVQYYKREMRDEFDQGLWSQAIGRASRMLREGLPRTSFNPR
jgi:hypothetical protein